jgi:hypothetical protein
LFFLQNRAAHFLAMSLFILAYILVHHTVLLFLLQNRAAHFLYFYFLVNSFFFNYGNSVVLVI